MRQKGERDVPISKHKSYLHGKQHAQGLGLLGKALLLFLLLYLAALSGSALLIHKGILPLRYAAAASTLSFALGQLAACWYAANAAKTHRFLWSLGTGLGLSALTFCAVLLCGGEAAPDLRFLLVPAGCAVLCGLSGRRKVRYA